MIAWAASAGYRAIQLDAAMPGMRPRELDRSARRDLAALLRRHELTCSGLDLWIPASHFTSAAHVDRALDACSEALTLSADLASLLGTNAGVISMILANPLPEEIEGAIRAACDRAGARLADHAWPPAPRTPGQIGVGLDPAIVHSEGEDATDAIHQHADVTLSARLSDLAGGVRTLPGSPEGRLDLLEYAMALSASGYERPVVADLRGIGNQVHAAEHLLERWTGVTRLPGR